MSEEGGVQKALAHALMPPPPSRPPRAIVNKEVVDEDAYTDAIEAIIE